MEVKETLKTVNWKVIVQFKQQTKTKDLKGIRSTTMADLIGAVTKVTSNFLEINQVKHLIFTRNWFFTATIDQVSIDNWGFKLFYKCTTVFLILSSVLTTAKQFFGSPIQCDAGSVSIYLLKSGFKIRRSFYNCKCQMVKWNLYFFGASRQR